MYLKFFDDSRIVKFRKRVQNVQIIQRTCRLYAVDCSVETVIQFDAHAVMQTTQGVIYIQTDAPAVNAALLLSAAKTATNDPSKIVTDNNGTNQ